MTSGTITLPARRPGRVGGLLALPAALTIVLALAILGLLAAGSRGGGSFEPSAAALAAIPSDYLALYQQAAASYGLDWTIVAAIGALESDHGRSPAPGVAAGRNNIGCCAGPMQFNLSDGPPSSWQRYAVDGDHNGTSNVYDPADAIPTAARFLRAHGAPADYAGALFAYNHAGWYVDAVLRQAAAYRGSPSDDTSFEPLPAPASPSAAALLANPNFSSYNPAWTSFDLAHGLVDARLVALLNAVVAEHRVGVWVFKTGHPLLAEHGISNHFYGRAVDIASVDDQPCDGSPTGACGRLAVTLAQIHGPLRLSELIYCFDPDPTSGDNWADPGHCNHIHAGYDAHPPLDP
jgi:hypothetical protein